VSLRNREGAGKAGCPIHPQPGATKKDEPALLAKVNETLLALDKSGEINRIWEKWLGAGTEYKMVRTDKVVPINELKFTPIP
jgi:polar amino acid transport system substrate-binding protein